MFWKPLKKKIVQCLLCPRYCIIKSGERGNCGVRENKNGKLVSLVYGKIVSANIDPIEKKPLYHFLPGKDTFSIATAGCNFHCMQCQNWNISQCSADKTSIELMPKKVVYECKKLDSKIISYTYTEPTIFYEYMIDTAKLAGRKKIRNVLVSNGFINREPLKKLIPFISAANIDLKGDDKFYRDVAEAWVSPILETLVVLKKKKVWLEVTNLIIPTLNDSPERIKWLAKWVYDYLGKDTPLHFSAFWPTHKLKNLPPTPIETLKNARKIAMKIGLKYVYTGNVNFPEGNNTYCPSCKKIVIKRSGFYVVENFLKNGKCKCGEKIAGVWK